MKNAEPYEDFALELFNGYLKVLPAFKDLAVADEIRDPWLE